MAWWGWLITIVCGIITIAGYVCCVAAGKEDEKLGLK